jgi:acetyltransferase-like isoleucine patch superfamily enzyme
MTSANGAPAAEANPTARPEPPRPFGAKAALKWLARAGATLLVSPLLLVYVCSAAFLGRDRALENATELLSLLPGLPGQYLRRAFLARVLAGCHPSAFIGFGSIFSKAGAKIDANVYIGPRCHIGLAHVERDVLIAAGVHLLSGARTHSITELSRPIREQGGVNSLVRVGAGAWIGSAAVVMADVGRDTVVGAGAVVTRPLPDGVIAVGVPARVVRPRTAVGGSPGPTDHQPREVP